MDKTAIVILHYKNEEDTIECLDSLVGRSKSKPPFKIIVVANCASEEFCSNLRKKYPYIDLVSTKENVGFAKGNNLGIEKARKLTCENIILLNNDTIIKDSFIDKLVSFARSDQSIGLVSPKIYFAKGFEYHKDRYKEKERGKVIWYAGGILNWQNIYASHRGVDEVDTGQFNKTVDTDFVTGCCVLIKKQVIDKIGFLDEKYFLYFEDVDYSVRARRSGFKVVYYPEVAIWHKNAASSDRPGSNIHVYYQTRNRLYFGFKYGLSRTKKALIWESIKMLFRGKVYRRAIIDFYLGKMKKEI